ncbi:MAG: winged helix-turn-helix transcriptional regulator [Candidatus Heimdallarchaeota archaeon]
MGEIRHCPVAVALQHLGKKWTIHILRDMLRGNKRFSDFLANSPRLSTKVLSARLKELQEDGLIEKRELSSHPKQIEYHLTSRGLALNKVIIELAIFSIEARNRFEGPLAT